MTQAVKEKYKKHNLRNLNFVKCFVPKILG